MYPAFGAVLVSLVLLIWLGTLSYFYRRQQKFLDQLFPKSLKDQSDNSLILKNRIEELIQIVEDADRKVGNLAKNLVEVKKDGLRHVQDLSMIRYNPYNDTGGEQSFSVVLLDGKKNGLLLTSLHSRAGTRVYIKDIKKGESDLELSKEERQVLEKAMSGS